MLTTLMVVLPIFALILVGFGCRRIGVFGPHATSELNRFVVYLALPALLFDIMANTSWETFYQPGFIATFGLGSLIVFGLTVALSLRRPRPLADASVDGLNAGYANVGFIGFPLCLIAFGKDSLAPTAIAAIITVCVVFALAIVLIEVGMQTEARPLQLVGKVARSLAKNPLLVAPALGAVFASTGLPMPTSAETFFKLLGAAASPCALVALGLFLAEERPVVIGETASSLLLTGLKLGLHPAVTAGFAYVFHLKPLLAHTAVVLAALPTGTGPFMLAEFYGREASVTSKTILISTIGSLATVTGYLAWIG